MAAMSDLPRELLEDILSRIPSESLRELRFTCKLWNALYKDRGCIKERFHKRTARELIIVVLDGSVYSLDVDYLDINERLVSNVIGGIQVSRFNRTCDLDFDDICVSDVFHCDGLLLLRTEVTNMLLVWNPCSGQTGWIQLMYHQTTSIFALGYHKELCDSYKILSIEEYPILGFSKFEIYELNSNSWRALDDVLDDVTLGCIIQSRGMSLKGNTYWIASQVKGFVLLSFDFTTEGFGRLNLPSQSLGYEVLALSLVREEKLSILQQNQDASKVEIWVTTNDEIDQTKALSWSKFLSVDFNSYFHLKLTCDVSFFIKDEEKKVAVCCDNKGIAYIFGENCDFGKVEIGSIQAFRFAAVSQAWFKFNLEALGNIRVLYSKPVWRIVS
ncbi:F-box domain [Arabidopsis suecica]|uniref:F-box domain n=1 Tax=Arabidopsis suecica TaxID=45249 RepID=A0A8T2B9R5_ARASU|nr:F-box domain [Arabidopsis suecica]